ncbi:MAG: hypothetical protein AAF772_00805 [Acidobacteriota bacterium]
MLTAGLGKPRRSEVDLLAHVPLRADGDAAIDEPEERLILVHVEIERTFNRAMDVRMARYYHQIIAQHEQPVVPLAIFLRGGRAPLQMRTVEERVAHRVTGTVRYAAFCPARCDPALYLASAEPFAWGLAALARSRGADRAANKALAIRRVVRELLPSKESYLLMEMIQTYLTLNKSEAARYAAITASDQEAIETMTMLNYEKAVQEGEVRGIELGWARGVEEGLQRGVAEGHQRGVEEGHQRGVEEGRLRGLRDTLELLLTQRFGPLSDGDRARLRAIDDLERLRAMTERVLQAPSLDALLR